MQRIYDNALNDHFKNNTQAALLCGPRQVGKTTICKQFMKDFQYQKYLNWDDLDTRAAIVQGPQRALQGIPLDALLNEKPIITFDELHKYKDWKPFLKGLIDSYKDSLNFLVTGSAQFELVRQSGESLMGRYFLYRIHPLSVAELISPNQNFNIFKAPQKIEDALFDRLWKFGGFPEPFIKAEERFYNRWQHLRQQQLIREDIQSLAQIHELSLLELLAHTLKQQSGQLVNYTDLSKKIRVSDQTIRRWMSVLGSFYYCFTISPWHQNVARSLLKEPKVYLWDWSVVQDKGQRLENFVASHLLKAIHFWNDIGLGTFQLYFLRTKDQKEVDFLITASEKPWMLIEVKSSAKEPLSKNLFFFQDQVQAKYVLQVAFDLPYVDTDCFNSSKPVIVSLKTFLSQLV
jgi:predicted AAA+ superfamily ATPase